jgi:hypothetical protein
VTVDCVWHAKQASRVARCSWQWAGTVHPQAVHIVVLIRGNPLSAQCENLPLSLRACFTGVDHRARAEIDEGKADFKRYAESGQVMINRAMHLGESC